MREIRLFWKAFDGVFEQEMYNESCGSHVHVKPSRQEYDMEGLRKIAYAVVAYEKHVLEFLPEERRNNDYCQPNTEVSPRLKQIFRCGRSKTSYNDLRDQIYAIDTRDELCTFMQGDQEGNRRVLWNFSNIRSNSRTGTIEFRGGPVLHTTASTIYWILFAVGFILLATEEVCDSPLGSMLDLGPLALALLTRHQDKLRTGNFSYVGPETPLFRQRASELWNRICNCTKRKITQKVSLPPSYETMNEHRGSSGANEDLETDDPEADDLGVDDSETDDSDEDDVQFQPSP